MTDLLLPALRPGTTQACTGPLHRHREALDEYSTSMAVCYMTCLRLVVMRPAVTQASSGSAVKLIAVKKIASAIDNTTRGLPLHSTHTCTHRLLITVTEAMMLSLTTCSGQAQPCDQWLRDGYLSHAKSGQIYNCTRVLTAATKDAHSTAQPGDVSLGCQDPTSISSHSWKAAQKQALSYS